jgi:hypothetical protein
MSHPRFAVWLVLLSCTVVLMTPLSGSERPGPEPRLSTASRSIVVTTAAELVAALSADPGDLTIFVQRGTYLLSHAIQVPDGTALIGEGAMLYDGEGLPTGFAPEGRTVIAAIAGVTGNFVTLADGASLQGLVIQDVVRPALTGGSPVAVSSRSPSDSVSAQVAECEIINPNPVNGPGLTGPVGRGLLAITRNSASAGGAASHEQSLVSVHLTQSIIRSPGGGDGIFAINFASGSQIELHLRRNVIGRLGANGGVSRPDSTVGATTLIQSTGNLYRADNPTPTSIGWGLNGGSDAPMLAPLIAEDTVNNKLSMHSVDDRIEGFGRAIVATAGVRMSALAGAIASNENQLILEGTRLASTTSDLELLGARNGVGMADGNELRVTLHNVIGSGPRANTYRDAVSNLGIGNRLIITGSLTAFSHTNEAISPMPGEQFFTAGANPFAKVRP